MNTEHPTKAERDGWRQGYSYYNRGAKTDAKRVLRLIAQVEALEMERDSLLTAMDGGQKND